MVLQPKTPNGIAFSRRARSILLLYRPLETSLDRSIYSAWLGKLLGRSERGVRRLRHAGGRPFRTSAGPHHDTLATGAAGRANASCTLPGLPAKRGLELEPIVQVSSLAFCRFVFEIRACTRERAGTGLVSRAWRDPSMGP